MSIAPNEFSDCKAEEKGGAVAAASMLR